MGLSSGQFAGRLCFATISLILSIEFLKEFSYSWVNIIAIFVFLLVRVNGRLFPAIMVRDQEGTR